MNINLDEWQKEVLECKGNKLLVSGRQVGKSYIISLDSSEYAVKNAHKSVLIISATERQAEELFQKCLTYIFDNYRNMIKKGKDRPTKHVIKLTNGSIIRCLPTGLAGVGIRGFTVDRLIADEAAYINEEVWQSVTPMLLVTGGDIVLVSTPHGREGYFYNCYQSKDFKVFHVNSEEVIKNRIFSNTWTEVQRQKALEHLEREKQSMSSLQYAQEYLGQFIDQLRQFFKDEIVARQMLQKRKDSIAQGKEYFLGLDIARLGDDEIVYAIVQRINNEKYIHVENIIKEKKYLSETYEEVLKLNRIYQFKEIYIDDGGIGTGVFDYLLFHPETKRKVIAVNNRARPLDYKEEHKKKILKEDLYNNLLGMLERGELELLNDDEVFRSFKSVQYEYDITPGAKTNFKIFGNYTHIVEAIARACWANRSKRLNIWVR